MRRSVVCGLYPSNLSKEVGNFCRPLGKKDQLPYSSKMKRLIVWKLGVLMAAMGIDGATAAPSIRAHEATYVMTQVRQYSQQSRDSFLIRADGVLKYRFEKTCEGWLVDHQNVLLMKTQDNHQIQVLSSYTSLESFDGSSLQFRGQEERTTNDQAPVLETIKGWAKRTPDHVAVTFTAPQSLSFQLPGDTAFPTSHLLEALERASEAAYVFGGPYFDGSDVNNQFKADTVVIPSQPMAAMTFDQTVLEEAPTWMLNLSFYPLNDPSSVPSLEIGARYRKDGVALQLRQDFGDLVVEGALKKFTYLPEPRC